MSLTLKLPGRRALSEFRLNKLLHQAKQRLPGLTGVRTQYWHFAKLRLRHRARNSAGWARNIKDAELNQQQKYGAEADCHLFFII